MALLWVGTSEGIARIGPSGTDWVFDRPVTHFTGQGDQWWLLTRAGELMTGTEQGWSEAAPPSDWRLNCVAVTASRVVVGTSEAHLLELRNGELLPVDSFETAPGRDRWSTPWGGPPDVRSVAVASDRIYVNVHVGGILAWDGQRWSETIDQQADVHQVITANGDLLAASARGLAFSRDAGASWSYGTAGLHATYERAVAKCGEVVLVSVSTGPRGGRSAIYRGTPEADWERCRLGLPEWFSDNVDTFWLSGRGSEAAFGTSSGEVYLSEDQGASWDQIAAGLVGIRTVELQG